MLGIGFGKAGFISRSGQVLGGEDKGKRKRNLREWMEIADR